MDLRSSVNVWKRVITNPGEAIFAEEMERPYARMSTAVIWLFAAGLVTVLIWMIIFILFDPIHQSLDIVADMWRQFGLSEAEVTELVTQMEQTADFTMFFMLCGLLMGIPLLTIIWSALLWMMAKLFGGVGSFERQTFLISTYTAPLFILMAFIYLIPLVGTIIIVGINFYILYLTYFALKAVHHLTSGQAMTSVLAPVIALFVAACCVSTLWLAMVSAALGSIA